MARMSRRFSPNPCYAGRIAGSCGMVRPCVGSSVTLRYWLDVVPARAGMIPPAASPWCARTGGPRIRGDASHTQQSGAPRGAVPARAGRSYRVAGFGRGRPISVMGRECMTPLLNSWFAKNDALYVGNFAMRPIPLFPGRLDPRRSLLVAGLRPRLKGRDWAPMYSKAPIAGRIGGLCGIIGGVRSVTEECKIISIY